MRSEIESEDPFVREDELDVPVAVSEEPEEESVSPWTRGGPGEATLEADDEDYTAGAGSPETYEEENEVEATLEAIDRYEFGDAGELESEDAERAALGDPEFGGPPSGEVSAPRVEVMEADGWTELELPPSVFPEAEEEAAPSALGPGLSSLAQRNQMHPGKGARTAPWNEHVYGLVVHTTGGALPGQARKAGARPDEYGAQYYIKSGGTHYVNGWAGAAGQQLHQVMNERQQAWGVGRWKDQPKTDQWRSNDAGRFELDLPATVVRLWRARWPGFKDSLSLLPVRSSANLTYVHVECLPCLYYRNGDGPLVRDPEASPMRDGLRFTRAQHETVARLAWDIAQRNQWPRQDAWWRTPRLLGHEDITPLSRHDQQGGWDPGGLREQPYFDWSFVYDYLARLSGGTTPTPSAGSIGDIGGSVGSLLGSLADRFRQLVRTGQEVLAITEAVRSGQSDVNQIANLVFFARHPELNGRRLRPDERQLAQEWLQIRDAIVRPTIARLAGAQSGETYGLSSDHYDRHRPYGLYHAKQSAMAAWSAPELEAPLHEGEVEWEHDVQPPTTPITVADLANSLTNLVFWARHPNQQGKKLKPNTKEANEWTQLLRDQVSSSLHNHSTEFSIAQLIFFARHPDVQGRFRQLPNDEQRKLQTEFDAIRAKEVRPWLGVQIARGRVNSRTIFVVDNDAFKTLPMRTRTRAGAEIAELFSFVGDKEPRAPIKVIFLEPARFPESFNLSDAVVSVTDTIASAFVNLAMRQQTKNINRAIREFRGRVKLDDAQRVSAVPDRLGMASSRKLALNIGGIGRAAIPQMVSVVLLKDMVSFLNEEHISSQKDKLVADSKKWSEQQQELVGIALGRAMAHEARHLYIPAHAAAGLGSDAAPLFGTAPGFSKPDQTNILTAIRQFEGQQGTATVITTFAAADRAGDFPF